MCTCMKQASFETELDGVAAFGDGVFLGTGLALAADGGVPDLLPTLGDGVDGWEF